MSQSRQRRRALVAAVAFTGTFTLGSTTAWGGGRPEDTSRNWFGDVSAGYGYLQGDSNDILDNDWVLSGGAMFWPSGSKVGVDINVSWGRFDFSDDALRAINTAIALDPLNSGSVDGGDVETWQLTVNAVWGLRESSGGGLYLTGGIGAYDLKGTLTNTGIVYYPPFCDPWYWWWCVPGGFGTGSVPVASDSTTELGFNFGLGYSFDMADGQLFVEAKYHRIDTDTEDLEYIPITIGFRW